MRYRKHEAKEAARALLKGVWTALPYNFTADDKLDPVRMSGGVCKIVRGGSWNDDAEACRSGYRFWLTPDNANALIGLRLARNAESGR